MPQIVRLTTQDTNCVFDAAFKEDVLIPEDSQIACYSVSTQINPTVLVVDAQNNAVAYTVEGEEEAKVVYMTPGTFRSDNVVDLMTDLTFQLNRSLENRSIQIGKQFQVSTVGRFFTVQCLRGTVSDMTLTSSLTGNVKMQTQDVSPIVGNVMSRIGAGGAINDAFFFLKSPLCKGAATMRAQVYNKGAIAESEAFFMGITAQPLDTTVAEVLPSDLTFGIIYNSFSLNYSIIQSGNIVTTTVPSYYAGDGSLLNDILSIELYDNEILAKVYRPQTNATVLIARWNGFYNHTTNYFPCYVFPGDSQWRGIETTTDPFYNISNKYSKRATTFPGVGVIPNVLTDQTLSQNYLQFADPYVSNFFGFKTARMPEVGFFLKDNILYQATDSFSLKDYSESFIVQLLSLSLPESYDSATGQRSNYLDIIPSYSVTRERVVYQSTNPIFLNLNNRSPINLRFLRARLLLEDGTSPSTYGTSQLTLLIRKRGEY
jgi:hypothetical protein